MRLKTFLQYAAIIAVTLIAGEVLARVFNWTPRLRVAEVGDDLALSRYTHSSTGFGDLVPNQNGHWVVWFHRPYHVQTNSAGLRNIEEPDERAFRILALGDSQTFGPYLSNEDTWPAWLESSLRSKPNAGPVQVFNGGVSGYTILDELGLFREKGIGFAPKVVVLAVYENDLGDLSKERNGVVQRPAHDATSQWFTSFKNVARKSALASLAEGVRNQMQFQAAGIDARRGEADPTRPAATSGYGAFATRYSNLYRQFATLAKDNNIALATVFIPLMERVQTGDASEMEVLVRTLSAATRVPYLDLTESMRRASAMPERLYLLQQTAPGRFEGNGHLSREGNAAIGAAIADWLREQRILPQ